MEEVLDLYAQAPDPLEPLICTDEASKQLLSDLYPSLPMKVGTPKREDFHYQRHGVRSLFIFFAPHVGWRRVTVSRTRTRRDWAREIKRLVDEDYPHARKIKLVCDNLNTHTIASLYETFPAEEAHRLARKLEIHYTPRNGSWLNMAEIDLSALSRDYLDQRIGSEEELINGLTAWQERRNRNQSNVKWLFTTEDARVRLRTLYPPI